MMQAHADANGLHFSPVDDSKFTGLLQLAYAGSTARGGDLSATSYFDAYRLVYSNQPKVSFCADDPTNAGYIDFDWNKHDVNGPTQNGQLLMITMPHQVSHFLSLFCILCYRVLYNYRVDNLTV